MTNHALPALIQGGMGVAVSSWRLARSVSLRGQLGVVSGTALDAVMARTLADGDPGGHLRRALAAFPAPEVAQRILDRYFLDGGRGGAPYRQIPMATVNPGRDALELTVAANFAEVWLAKEGHGGIVGINFLEKVQMAAPAAALGAVLAGVDYVLVGAGIPREFPTLLAALASGRPGGVHVTVAGGEEVWSEVDPVAVLGRTLAVLHTPRLLAIISLHSLAGFLARSDTTRPFGFVVEGPSAGGHSAPPRGQLTLDADGDPIYSERDVADLDKLVAVGLPFWIAGGASTPEALRAAQAAGAVGVQSGTVFALASESGLTPDLRGELLALLGEDGLVVRNSPRASPTAFPFKLANVEGTLSDAALYEARERRCDLGYLRQPYQRGDGSVGYRCAAEPVADFVTKGGTAEDAEGRLCLCNTLLANVGLGQVRASGVEVPGLTLGQDLVGVRALQERHPDGWSADQAIDYLLGAQPLG